MAYAHYVRAFVLCNRDQMEEAGKAIGEALRLDPRDADYFALLSYIRASQGRWQESLETADSGLQINAEHVDSLNRRALALAHLGRKEEAVAVIQAALTRDPENPRTFANCGWVYLQTGDPASALRYYRDAMGIHPRLKSVRQGVTDALLQLVQKGQRLPDLGPFGLALRHDPELQAGRQKIVEALLQRRRRPFGSALGVLLILGWVFGTSLLGLFDRFSRDHADLTPLLVFGWLAGILFCAFYFPSRLADPLYCLLIRRDPVAGSLFSPDQVRASDVVAGCLVSGAVALTLGLALAQPLPLFAGLVLVFLAAPVARVYQCAGGRPRWFMTGYTAAVAALGVATVGLAAIDARAATLSGFLFLAGVGLTDNAGQICTRFATVR